MNTARELADTLAALLHREHDALAEFLVALAKFNERRAWMELGYASLFQFLNRELHLSLGSAQYRKVAAELIQEVPAVADALRRGDLCFTTVIEASKVVTAANWETVLPRFYGLSRREAAEIVAGLQPHPAPPVRMLITSVPSGESRAAPAAPNDGGGAPLLPLGSPAAAAPVSSVEVPRSSAPPPSPKVQVEPLTADLSRVHLTVPKEVVAKLRQAADARPDLTMDQILAASLDLLLNQSAKRKGLTDRPQKNPRPSKHDDHIPARVKREVMLRSGGRCEATLANGERCGSTHDPEFHHRTARALGGKGTSADEVMLTCRGHNELFARQDFGHEVMDRCTGRGGHITDVAPDPRAVQPRL